MNTKEEIIEFLKQNRGLLSQRYHVARIGLFGSFARGEQTERSDVDLLVDLDESAVDVYDTKNALKSFLSASFGRDVDIAREKYLKPYAKELILKDALYV
ncbi:MAG: nucleotidyltransferase family protein [Campylobacterales bacterium]